MKVDLLVVGDIAWDTVVRASRWPERDQDFLAEIREGPGGQGFNIAVWARATGAPVALVTQLGRGARSQELGRIAGLRGVELCATTWADPLTRVVSIVDGEGQRALLTHPGPGPLAPPGEDWSAGMLVLSGYLLARPGGGDRVTAWLAWATRRGIPVAADLSHPDVAGAFAPYAARLAWLFGNEAEWAAFACPQSELPPNRVVKRGALGAKVVAGSLSLSAVPPDPVAAGDSTGAGDCLMGTLLGALATGRDLAAAFALAMERAAAVSRMPGSLPDIGQQPPERNGLRT